MLYLVMSRVSRAMGHGRKATERDSRRARIDVDLLEGRRLMDAGASASLLAAAQAHANLAYSQHVEVQTALDQVRAQLATQTQAALTVVHSSEQQLRTLIALETQQVKATAHGGASVAASVLAHAKAELKQLQRAEKAMIKASASASAHAQHEASASLRFCVQAEARAQQEIQAAAQGVGTTAASLGAQVEQAVSAAQRTKATAEAAAAAVVQGTSQTANSLSLQVQQTIAAAQQSQVGLQVGLGVSASGNVHGQASF